MKDFKKMEDLVESEFYIVKESIIGIISGLILGAMMFYGATL